MSNFKDIKLDKNAHDLLIENYDLSLVNGIDRVIQNLKIVIWFFFIEWYLDTSKGVRFYEDILIKNPNLPNIEVLLKDKILQVADVEEILEFDIDYNAALRSMSVTFKVRTTFGVAPISEEL